MNSDSEKILSYGPCLIKSTALASNIPFGTLSHYFANTISSFFMI